MTSVQLIKDLALTDEIIDHVPVQPASSFTGNFLTIVAASTAFAAYTC